MCAAAKSAPWGGKHCGNVVTPPTECMNSSVHFDLITQEMLHLQLIGGFHAGPGPHWWGMVMTSSLNLLESP